MDNDNDNNDNNNTTDYFTPCTCTRGNYTRLSIDSLNNYTDLAALIEGYNGCYTTLGAVQYAVQCDHELSE